jgi:histidinol-phosphate phosphatase family protein
MPARFEQALGEVKRLGADLVAATGDLLDMPGWVVGPRWGFEPDNPGPWLAAAEADYRLMKELLDASGMRYVVLPGNHDSPALMWKVFGRKDDIFDLAGHRVVRFCDEEYECHLARRFLKERERFDAVLAEENSPPQVHLQHYVLTPRLNQGYPHTYDEGDELTRRVAAGPVRLCLSGHYHTGTPLSKQGNAVFAVGPAFCQWPFPWRMYEIQEGGEVTMAEHTLEKERATPRPVVFLDRDGVINDLPSYRYGPEEMRLIPEAGGAIRRLNEAGYAVVVITSQSAVGCGYVTEAMVVAVHDKMMRLLALEGAEVDGIYFSTAAGEKAVLAGYRDQALCKPKPALLERAARDLNLTMMGGGLVGDRLGEL